MKNNNPHKPLRSSWRNEAFRKPSTRKGSVVVSKSIGRNNSHAVAKVDGQLISSGSFTGYQY